MSRRRKLLEAVTVRDFTGQFLNRFHPRGRGA